MPRDGPRTGHSQAEAKEESQHEFRMRELLDAVLNGLPRIAFGIGGAHLGHLFGRVGTESG